MPLSGLSGLERTNLREQALDSLRRAITSGAIPPGTHLVETELSAQLGISRGTLREAMRQLQQERLLTLGARGRLAVRHLEQRDLTEIFAVRGALEGLAAEAVASLPEADREKAVRRLRSAVAAMDVPDEEAFDERIEADLKVHRLLCELSGNRTLLHQWESLGGSIRMTIVFAGLERAVRNMDSSRHAILVDAIASGDPAAARAAVLEHMRSAESNLS
ncbi:GntR family transcriptional regulator [Brevibacterium sediminis]|uniref:GntR family transcriptional regulator n=1 Tax=Brevibacterium sediminis TaxID=1857024 RepID=A0ABQ1M390_9MICO|nr:GntR family transcriptional regulator [Brevibacterium sediminis]GGC34344.1 GntR family transcriptional regulator [Brevibacterium sediminis]